MMREVKQIMTFPKYARGCPALPLILEQKFGTVELATYLIDENTIFVQFIRGSSGHLGQAPKLKV